MLQQIIQEDLLHYVWKTKQLSLSDLRTTDGRSVQILDFGTHNHDSGPDFFNGKAIIDGTLWVGNIEMHIFSSDWEKHSHDSDPAYDNVILHIVYEEDKAAYTSAEAKLPCIELKDRISDHIKQNYAQLLQATTMIPCESVITQIDEFTVNMWKNTLIAERLESKSAYIKEILDQTTHDWDATLYTVLARYMGSRVNTIAFEALAKALSLQTILKNIDSPLSIEALLYGVGGMLDATYKDEYFIKLKSEYNFLKKKYSLGSIPATMWKFSKMRPANFPTVRISQLASLLLDHPRLFSKILEVKGHTELRELFKVSASEYWDNHYRFDTESITRKKKLTESFIDLLLINVIVPILFLYGKEKNEPSYSDRAIDILEQIKGEKNNIVSKWNGLGINTSTAMDTQALIHLRKEYCDKKRCLDCHIGYKIVKGR